MEITSSEICSNLLFLLIRLSNFSIKTERNSRFFQPFPFHHRNFPPPRTHDLPSLPPSPSQSLSRQQKNPLIEAKHRSARKTCERMKGRKRKTNKARIPYAYDWRGTANEGKEREGGVEREKGWGEKERDKKKRKEVYPRRGVEGRQRGKQGGRQGGRQAGRASVHGRATHARSIKRAFTIDQRSIEVDHELKTVVTREARRPRQLFARLCKYLAAERRTRRWAPLGWGAVHARPAPSNHVQRYGARECTYIRASRRADIIILGLSPPPSPDFSLRGPEHGMRPNAIAPISNGLSHPRTVRTAGIKNGWPIDWVAHSDGFRKSIGNRRFPAIVLDRRRVDGSRVLLTRSRFYDVKSRMRDAPMFSRSAFVHKWNEEQARLQPRREN